MTKLAIAYRSVAKAHKNEKITKSIQK